MNNMRPGAARVGFAYVEFMVTVLIIGVLASALMPATKGWKKARTSVCQHNLRQLGIAL